MTGWAAAGAAAAGAVGGVTSGLLNMASNRRANKRMVDFWKMQNEYNHPSAQMARLQEAGLNPRLIYGQNASGASGNADSLRPVDPPKWDIDLPVRNITDFQDIRLKSAQTDNLRAQNTVINNEALVKAAQAAKLFGEGKSARIKAEIDDALMKTSIQYREQQLKKLEADTLGSELDARFKDNTLSTRALEVFYKANNAREELRGTELLNTLRQLEIELNRMGIYKTDSLFMRLLGRNAESAKDKFNEFELKARNYLQNKLGVPKTSNKIFK